MGDMAKWERTARCRSVGLSSEEQRAHSFRVGCRPSYSSAPRATQSGAAYSSFGRAPTLSVLPVRKLGFAEFTRESFLSDRCGGGGRMRTASGRAT